MAAWKNRLYYGDNLDVLQRYVKDESVDLVYLDPPFQSGKNYNVLFESHDETKAAAQIRAFEDTWEWNLQAQESYERMVASGEDASRTIEALYQVLGPSHMMAYLAMMAPRLVELHRTLAPTGSIYLHCDPRASHYLKVLMDAVFGKRRFLNEIVWCYNVGGKGKRLWARKHDILLFYSKGPAWYFDGEAVGVSRDTGTKSFGGKIGVDEKGRRYQDKLAASGKYYRYYLDAPKIPEDWWVGINSIQSQSSERLGYPTQKPVALLERIIRASCPKGGYVLDPFCGCGTAVHVAQKLGRRWIGIDITCLATNLIKNRLRDAFGDKANFNVVGEPVDLEGARQLAEADRFQFQCWALGFDGARATSEQKKGADRGVDGRLMFFDDPKREKASAVIFSVKSGATGPTHVRDLRGVIEREKAAIGAFITLRPATKAMQREAVSAGFYESAWGRFPRLQILTVEELLDGKRIEYPARGYSNVTLPKAQREKPEASKQHRVPLADAAPAKKSKSKGGARRR